MLFTVTYNKEHFQYRDVFKARSDKTIPHSFRTNSGSKCINGILAFS